MAGLATTGRSSQPTNPPPTCYKPPPMKSITSFCKSSTNKTNTSKICLMQNISTTAYGTAPNPSLTTDKKLTMAQPMQQLHKLPQFPKLQKLIKMTNRHSKVITRTTVQPPSHPFQLHSKIGHPSAANLTN